MVATRAALIVAGYEYQDPGLRRLRAPAQDAEALPGVLGDPKIGDFDVHTLLNEPEYAISRPSRNSSPTASPMTCCSCTSRAMESRTRAASSTSPPPTPSSACSGPHQWLLSSSTGA